MQLEIKTEGVDFVVSRAPLPKNDNDGRQKSDRETGAPLHVVEKTNPTVNYQVGNLVVRLDVERAEATVDAG